MRNEIMERDLALAVKKAKAKYRYESMFYITAYGDTYFADAIHDKINVHITKIKEQKDFVELWKFEKTRWIKI